MQRRYKLVSPGKTSYGRLFIEIEYKVEDGKDRLSISGVEGPMRNGDARGSCGQCRDALDHLETRDPGWTDEMVENLKAIWDRWHLNDMRPGCEHQRAERWGNEELEVVTYRLTTEARQARAKAVQVATEAAIEGRACSPELTPTQKALLQVKTYHTTHTAPDADSPLSGCYEVSKRETKHANWVTENEHPRGLLSKPCPVCGYKYGSAWLHEPVPEDVKQFLASLPESEHELPGEWAS